MDIEYRVSPKITWTVTKIACEGEGTGGIQTIAHVESREFAVEIATQLAGGEDAVTVDPQP